MQSSWWARFRSFTGFEYVGAVLQEGSAVAGGGLVAHVEYAEGQGFYYIQDGPVLPAEEPQAQRVFQSVLGYLEQRRHREGQTISHLRIEPRWEHLPSFVQGFARPGFGDKYREPRNTLYIPLQLSDEALLAQMKPKGRYNIKVAQRHGVRVVEDNSEQGIADFIQIYRSTTVRQEIKAKPAHYFQDLMEVMGPDQRASIFFAEYQGQRLAAAMVVYFGNRATYFYGGSLTQHREVMAPYGLHFQIMCSARDLGFQHYDLYGVAPPDKPNHRFKDISIFKRKFGGFEVRLVPTLDLVYDRAAYEQFRAIKGWN
jgi:lipid II:glycine glycyltransferase (peptidoglycan interpeptide bridge formation enzyme)